METSAARLRSAVARYLAGAGALYEVEEEIFDVLLNDQADSEATKIAASLELTLAEWSRGDRSLDSVRCEFAEHVTAAAILH